MIEFYDAARWGALLVAGFLGGALNAVAGGGSFIIFPALIWAGVPPMPAGATNALCVLPGYLSSAVGFRRELSEVPRARLIKAAVAALIGGICGALLLLSTSNAAFGKLIPWLLLFGVATFAFSKQITANLRGLAGPRYEIVFLTLACLYGGYFNGGLGVILLAVFAVSGMTDVNAMNGLKSGLSFALTAISIVVFASGGVIFWGEAAVAAIGAALGGYYGAAGARRLSQRTLRVIVVITGLAMSVIFFVKALN